MVEEFIGYGQHKSKSSCSYQKRMSGGHKLSYFKTEGFGMKFGY